MAGWDTFFIAAVLVLVRVSGLMLFAPFFSADSIPRIAKVTFAIVLTAMLVPVAATQPGAMPQLGLMPVLGELSTGFLFGICLNLLMEMLGFAGELLGLQFSFSLVNILDPNSQVDTPLMSQMLNLIGLLVILAAGLDRTLLSALMRTFAVAPVGSAGLSIHSSFALLHISSGVFLAAVQLAAPVLAATMLVDIVVALVGRLSPQMPVLFVGVPLKTLIGYTVLIGSLGIWPRFIEARFDGLLNQAMQMVVSSHRA